jgi:AmmeMemoRadiSam system protein B/AmmeMemoRadiSam system protein A
MNWLPHQLIAPLPQVPLPGTKEQQKERKAGVAGSFYPAEPEKLTAMIDQMLAQVSSPPIEDPIIAVVAPHAGYPYSGPVAAYSYAALKGHKYTRVIVIAPSHFESFNFSSVYAGDAYTTPLGSIPVDHAFTQQLAEITSTIRLSGKGHDPKGERAEHAIEVQLPWLQRVLGEFALVPIIMGDQSYESSRALGLALTKLIQASETPEETLIVASSDLSHYHPYDDAVTIDHKTLHAIESWDYFSMSRNFQARIWEACGGAPIVSAMIAAERMGANRAQVLQYANSGDATGDHAQVVGYGAEILVKAKSETVPETPFSLSEEEKNELLALARKSVEQAVSGDASGGPAVSTSEALQREYGAFVTLHESGNLRGCIGFTSAMRPLYLTVWETAMLASQHDPRFQPVAAAELPLLQYEISVLSPLRRILDPQQIVVGRHGLLVKNGPREGLLLPQVPVEQRWDRQTFLEHTCLKAGLPSDSWKNEETDIFAFTAEVFGEQS